MANIQDNDGSWSSTYPAKGGVAPGDKALVQDASDSGKTKVVDISDIESRRLRTGNASIPWAQNEAYWPFPGQIAQLFNDPNNGNALSVRFGDNPQPPTRQYLDIDAIRFEPLPAYTVTGWPGTLTANANGAIGYSLGSLVAVTGESSSDRNGLYVVSATGDASSPWVLNEIAFWGHPNGYSQYQGGAIYRVRPWQTYSTAEFSYRADTNPVRLEYLRGGAPTIVSGNGEAYHGLLHHVTANATLTFSAAGPKYWEVWRLAQTRFEVAKGVRLILKHADANVKFERPDGDETAVVSVDGPATVTYSIRPDANASAVKYRLIQGTAEVTDAWETKTRWGVAVGHDSGYAVPTWADPLYGIGVKSVRGFADYQPHFDQLVATGFEVTGILQWWPSGGSAHFPVEDLAGWQSYVAARINAYPQVKKWEVWNEPPNFAGASPSAADQATILAAAYDVAKSINPALKIGLTAKSAYIRWLANVIDGGAAAKFDYITLHPYETSDLTQYGWEGQYLSIVPAIRKMLAAKAPAKKDVPIIFTEIGIPAAVSGHTGGVSEALQADQLVKYYTMGLAQGVETIHWFEAWDGDYDAGNASSVPFGLLAKPDNHTRPAYAALAALIAYLGSVPKYLGWLQLGGANSQEYGFAYESNGAVVVIGWAQPGTTKALSFEHPVAIVDPVSGPISTSSSYTLTEHPVILTAQSGPQVIAWRTQLAANKGKPFPWGGVDYTSATSVTLSAANGAQGVHLINPPAVSQVNGYSVFSRQGNGAAWTFTVDPNFLPWDTDNIRITAVLHKLGSNGAYFNVQGERAGSAGYASIGSWNGNGVAAGSRVTVSWDVSDAQFYGYFGYNFLFNLDGQAGQSNFAVESVTVTKL